MEMWIKYIAIALIGYLLGSVSPAYFIGKYIKKTDVRKKGSGNLGATNVLRVLGAKSAIATFVFDVLKGFLTMLIADLMFNDAFSSHGTVGMFIGGLAVVLGHNFPFYLNFKGGKGISTSFGVALYLNPFGALCLLLLEWLITLSTGYVSLASVINCIAYPLAVNLIKIGPRISNIYIWILCIFVGLLGVIRHSANIKRLMQGKENKFMLGKTIKNKTPTFKDDSSAQSKNN